MHDSSKQPTSSVARSNLEWATKIAFPKNEWATRTPSRDETVLALPMNKFELIIAALPARRTPDAALQRLLQRSTSLLSVPGKWEQAKELALPFS